MNKPRSYRVPPLLTAGCVDTELPLGRCDYARPDESVGESACLHRAMWVYHTEMYCENAPPRLLGE
jgi:hypothetical protein